MTSQLPWIQAQWPEPKKLPNVRALTTIKITDWPALGLPAEPHWLSQVHGTAVVCLEDWQQGVLADGAWTNQPKQVAAVKTADCLPILLASDEGPYVGAVHAGWRGLLAGVVEQAILACPVPSKSVQAWIGPAISQQHFEVGDEVHQAFVAKERALGAYFRAGKDGHWWADLAGMASHVLHGLGVVRVATAPFCTFGHHDLFYSYRRGLGADEQSARMASLIWLE